ncbi:rhomboid family intramembrane serine protease [Arachidicoccus sp.]|uniref:rhomboid family intramembrane serine protease n=1 Tax=Arachidicoccus sp. TaxID=1872624 RepID=UPI003D1FF88D
MYVKIRKLIIPFFVVTFLFVGCYTFLNWFLLIKNNFFTASPAFVEKDLAFVIAWIPSLIWLRPRIALLDIKEINRNYFLFFYQLFAVCLMAFCANYAQKVLYLKMHGHRVVGTLSETGAFRNDNYFVVKDYYLDTSRHPAFRTVVADGSVKDSAELKIFICCPMYENAKDTARHLADYWLGFIYTKRVSDQTSQQLVPMLLANFDNECQLKFQKDVLKKIDYLEKIDSTTELSRIYDDAADKAGLDVTGADRIFFKPRYRSYAKISAIAWAKAVYVLLVALVFWSLAIAFIPFRIERQEEIAEEEYLPFPAKDNPVKKFFGFLVPKDNYLITPWILYINAFIFLVLLCSFTGFFSFPLYVLYDCGGNVGFVTIGQHQWWRLISAAFLHQGIFHFVGNMFFLVIIGACLEPVIGRWKFILLYAVAIIVSSLVSAYHNWNVVAVGASGAIMGLYGAFYILVLTKSVKQKISPIFIWSVGIYTLINFLLGFTLKGIDNAAHVGGLVAGILMGIVFMPFIRRENKNEEVAEAILDV